MTQKPPNHPEDPRTLIRELAEQYDSTNQNTYITIYFNKNEDPQYFDHREHACASALNTTEETNFHTTMERIKTYLHTTNATYGAIYASVIHDFFKTLTLKTPIYNALIVDTSPYIRPLARILDEWESFTLVLLDSHTAKIIDIDLGHIEKHTQLLKDIMNKHKKGGQSQARFQRLRKGAIHQFLKDVIESLEEHHESHIILAGPGTTKKQFYDQLPKHLQQLVLTTLDIDINNENRLIQESFKHISSEEQKATTRLVNHLKKEILTDGLATYGFDHTLQAAQQGKIDILFVEKDYKVKGCICEHCQIVRAGPIKDCPICGQPASETDAIEEIIEFAERTNATIEFTDDPFIAELGHIAALLRYK
ncbi:MAG: hypothetical protein KKC68_07130 [Candidatus Thermoplasmatota archaeon]|nr:hypothetical protein [Candidatus Thermoplasmatota archaeon]MBU1941533.1 hypothetical protein [Candidatus Thermoplasmatota archaeon]